MEVKNNNSKVIAIITIIVTVMILSGLYIYRNGNPFTAKKIENVNMLPAILINILFHLTTKVIGVLL